MNEGPVSSSPFFSLNSSNRSGARRGRLWTRRGTVETPAFMPVGTQATVKTVDPAEVAGTGAEIILCNTYHLMLRPGVDTLEQAGGLHQFMGWRRPILTDSGGFQVFSLGNLVKVTEAGVRFQSHIDGSRHELTPENVVSMQARWGSDIAMPLDHLISLPAPARKMGDAVERTHRWLDRSIEHLKQLETDERPSLFGICQGGTDTELRKRSAMYVTAADVAGCAIGGLSVGESKADMDAMLEITCPILPVDKPRYLMGVGSPEDLWASVARGIDMFDCVLPTRLARNGALFTPDGRVDINARIYRDQHLPVEESCDCSTCARFTAAYLHHLFKAKEVLGLRLATVHNLRFLMRQMESIRAAIDGDTFEQQWRTFRSRYRAVGEPLPSSQSDS